MPKPITYQFELIPNGAHIRKMRQFCESAYFVFNQALAYQKEQHQVDNSFKCSYTEIANFLSKWKRELDWLKNHYSQVLQQNLKNLEKAFSFLQDCKLERQNNCLYFPKISCLRYCNSRSILREIKNITVRQRYGKRFVLIQIETEQRFSLPSSGEISIAHFATVSNGDPIKPINAFKDKLAKLQKQLPYKIKFSKIGKN